MTPENMKNDYNWNEAFNFGGTVRTATNCSSAPFGLEDVEVVIAAEEGSNDEESWVAAGILKDGRYFFLDAWCDYTGWDCQAGGEGQVADTLKNLIRYGMDEKGRTRLRFKLEEE